MAGKYEAPRQRKGLGRILLLLLLFLVAIAAVAVMGRDNSAPEESIQESLQVVTQPLPTNQPSIPETIEETAPTTQPPVTVTSSATIAAQGDLLMHATIFAQKYQAECFAGDGSYNFDSVFQYISEYVSSADYAVANLETTLGGDGFPYQGNPTFNCPDDLLDDVSDAGYDMLLTANNHSYDTLMTGINRTLEQVREVGLDTLGTRLSEEEPRFVVEEINGIRVGMVCYTYTMTMSGGRPQLNDNSPVENPEQINYFTTSNLTGFYSEIEEIMAAMQEQGAEATMLFLHWGTEYEITENTTQQKIAQKMCDFGFDVIVGGHPHVVQPVDLLTSTENPEHKTVCIYSLGNAVSNQRRNLMRLKTGHTEDGALFTVTFKKYSDGTVSVGDVNVLPTWVRLFKNDNGKNEYNILPIDMEKQAQWKELFGISEDVCSELNDSYNRTMDIVGEGLKKCRDYLEGTL